MTGKETGAKYRENRTVKAGADTHLTRTKKEGEETREGDRE